MGVRPGYKQTEVGVIPEDWEVKTISDVASVKTGPFGSALHERDYVLDGTPIITVEHLSENGVIHKNLPLVSDADKIRLKSYILRKNDIVFSRVGSVDRNSLISKTENGWLFSGRLLRVRTSNKSIHPPYLSYCFHSEPFKKRVRNVAVGQTMASLNTQILNGISVVLPPFIEQRAIATALSDVDALIQSLDKLISKKWDIKQAIIQELLTGKKRLPGFRGKWEVKRLGELLYYEQPTKFVVRDIDFSLSEHKRYWISEYQFLKVKIPDLKEQAAISEVLSDMDSEIAALEKRRSKTRLLKQEMMQELLTGKTRLV